MAVKKKTKKKASKKKVTKKKVTRRSNSSDLEPILPPLREERDGVISPVLEEIIVTGSRIQKKDLRKAARGEFRGDFTRDTFDPKNKFSRVLLQQGRVQLDADWNEQTSINLHHLRNIACDIGSEHWGPHEGAGFELDGVEDDMVGLEISPGHYYVNGILCEVDLDDSGEKINYVNQPFYSVPDNEMPFVLKGEVDNGRKVLAYLDVWERHYNYINDDSIREVALGGPDTATRAKVIWQVKALVFDDPDNEISGDNVFKFKNNYQSFLSLLSSARKTGDDNLSSVIKIGTGKLCVRVKDKKDNDNDPCLIARESRYRGTENQLYRIEIHQPGVPENVALETNQQMATFKWSRENSSVIFPIIEIQGNIVSLEHLGKDCRYGLEANDWVEIVDDDLVLQCKAENLVQVDFVDKENRQVILKTTPDTSTGSDPSKQPYLRRWDHKDGDESGAGIAVKEGAEGNLWLDIEAGIQVKFSNGNKLSSVDGDGNTRESFNANYYQTGDYWLIPARTITGDIEWPKDKDGNVKCVAANGIIHHYAPLALFYKTFTETDTGAAIESDDVSEDLRRILRQAWD